MKTKLFFFIVCAVILLGVTATAIYAMLNHEIRLSMLSGQAFVYALFACLMTWTEYQDAKEAKQRAERNAARRPQVIRYS